MPWRDTIFTADGSVLPPSTTWTAAHVDVHVDVTAALVEWWQCHRRYSDGGCATIAAEELCLRHDAAPDSLFAISFLPSSEEGAELPTKTSSSSSSTALSTTETLAQSEAASPLPDGSLEAGRWANKVS